LGLLERTLRRVVSLKVLNGGEEGRRDVGREAAEGGVADAGDAGRVAVRVGGRTFSEELVDVEGVAGCGVDRWEWRGCRWSEEVRCRRDIVTSQMIVLKICGLGGREKPAFEDIAICVKGRRQIERAVEVEVKSSWSCKDRLSSGDCGDICMLDKTGANLDGCDASGTD
jgi:hypothetical protein